MLNSTLKELGNPSEPTRSKEILLLLKQWTEDPLLNLEAQQLDLIKDTLRRYGAQ